MSNYKIAFLQKLRLFQDRFKCKPLFCDKIRYFHAKNYRKNSVSNNLQNHYNPKIRGICCRASPARVPPGPVPTPGFLVGQSKCQSLYNDKIPHIYAKNDTKNKQKIAVNLQIYYKLKIRSF